MIGDGGARQQGWPDLIVATLTKDAKVQTVAFSLLTDRARDRLMARVMRLRKR